MPDLDLNNAYSPPGVYIEEETTPVVAAVGILPTVVAIVGPAVGYRVHTEAITLEATTPVSLAKLGVFGPADPTHGAAFRVTAADGTPYEGSDYDFLAAGGEDGQIGTTQDNTSTLARDDTGNIGDGETVYVSYRYQDTSYNAPLRARDYDDVKDAFGEPLDLDTGAILSPLSLAARLALENGASELVLVATTGSATATTRAELQAALAKLGGVQDVNVVVLLPVGITGTPTAAGDTVNVGSDLKTHVEAASADGNFRIGILGYEKTVTVTPETLAAGFSSSRVMLAWPNRLNYFNGYANQTLEISGYYLAAAYAGQLSSYPMQMPLTKKTIRGFAGLPSSVVQAMTVAQKNAWSDAGVAVTEVARTGLLVVRHGTSTDRTNVNSREVSLTRARDAKVRLIQDTAERAELIGTPIDAETPIRIKGVIAGCLETAKRNGLIVDWINLKVRVRSVDPSVIEVKYEYRPAYPLNYIVISYSIDTRTGETTLLEAA